MAAADGLFEPTRSPARRRRGHNGSGSASVPTASARCPTDVGSVAAGLGQRVRSYRNCASIRANRSPGTARRKWNPARSKSSTYSARSDPGRPA